MQKLSKIIIVAFLLISLDSFGQSTSIGIALGPTYSKPMIKNTAENSSTTKYSHFSDAVFSVFGQHNFKENFGLVLDVGLCHRGIAMKQPVTIAVTDPSTLDVSYQYKNDKYRNQLSYLDNYLLAKYIMIDKNAKKVQAYVNAGPYYSVLLKTRRYIVDEYYDDNGYYGINEVRGVNAGNIRSSYKKSDLGFALGGGLEYGRFGLDYRYSLGFINISNIAGTKMYSRFSTVKLTFVMAKKFSKQEQKTENN